GAVLGDDNHLYAGSVAVSEVDALQTILGNGHAGHAHVILAGLNAADDGTKLGVHNGQLHIQVISNGSRHFRVDTHHLVVLIVLIGGEVGVGGHNELFLALSILLEGQVVLHAGDVLVHDLLSGAVSLQGSQGLV